MYLKIVIVCLIGVFIHHCINVIRLMGFHIHVNNHEPGRCKQIPGIEFGSEDIETLPNGLAFISSGLLMPLQDNSIHGDRGRIRKGRIFLFNFKEPKKGVLELSLGGFDQEDFYPHGLSSWEEKGTLYLFVVNHPHRNNFDTIEKFQFVPQKNQLKHVETFASSEFKVLNDVAATGEDSFYTTNYMKYRSKFLAFAEHFSNLPFGSLLYYDGHTYTTVDDYMLAPNGITLTPDKKYLYLLSPMRQSFMSYAVESNYSVTFIQEYDLYTLPDNPTIEFETGAVYIGSHPVSYKAMQHMLDTSQPAPSQVLKLTLKDGRVTSVTEAYQNDGSKISGSSVASRYGNQMLIGSVHDRLILCDKLNDAF